MRFLSVTLLLITLLFTSAYAENSFSDLQKSEIEGIIEKYIQEHPEALVDSIRQHQQKMRQAKDEEEFDASLKHRVSVDIGSSPVMGPDSAPITMIEFSDFQCPFCARSEPEIEAVMKKYKGKIKLVFKNLPLGFHPKARVAAYSAMSAGEQGAFWKMKKILLANQHEWAKGDAEKEFEKYAKKLGLNIPRFLKDRKTKIGEYEKQIKNDEAVAKKLSISGTPTFIINGVIVRGARPAAYFGRVIDKLLNEQ